MRYPRFAVYNFTGAALWAVGLPVLGYTLAGQIPPETLDRYLLIIIVLVVILSVMPTGFHLLRANRTEIVARVRSGGRSGAGAVAAQPGVPTPKQSQAPTTEDADR
jgi:hypothetical protein